MGEPVKILHVEAGRHLYGGARQVLYLLEGLPRHEVRNFLVAPPDSDIAVQAGAAVDDVFPVTMRGDLDVALVGRIARVARRVQADLIHLHSRRGADVYGGLAARLMGIPAVLSRRVDNPEARWLVSLKYHLYDRVITISEGIRQVLLREGLAPDKVVCVHSAIRAAEYAAPCDRAALRRELGLPEQAIVAAMIAQLIPRKGHRHLLAALPAVLRAQPALHIALLGKGALRQELEREAQRKGLAANVHFLGFREDLPGLLGCVDFLVHPADMEGLGVSLLQGAAAGLPLIGSRAGGIPEIVRQDESGLLIEPANIPALAHAMTRLATDPGLRERLGAGARRLVAREFDVAAMVAGNLAVYREVLTARRARSEAGSR
jgi:glycosyltransferase involved in cell wall biosynthesis